MSRQSKINSTCFVTSLSWRKFSDRQGDDKLSTIVRVALDFHQTSCLSRVTRLVVALLLFLSCKIPDLRFLKLNVRLNLNSSDFVGFIKLQPGLFKGFK